MSLADSVHIFRVLASRAGFSSGNGDFLSNISFTCLWKQSPWHIVAGMWAKKRLYVPTSRIKRWDRKQEERGMFKEVNHKSCLAWASFSRRTVWSGWMIPPRSWVWKQTSGLWTGCFLGNQWLLWGSSKRRRSAPLYSPERRGSTKSRWIQQEI